MTHMNSLRPGNIAALLVALLLPVIHGDANAAKSDSKGDRNLVITPAQADKPTTSSQRVALVIGNSNYATAPLANPVNDARAFAQALRETGFSVVLVENASLKDMLGSIRNFGDQLRKGGVGLFYYAGHGMQIKGRNYLIPVGSAIEREDEVAYAAVDAQAILDKMDAAGNGTNVMILDACRNNPFARSFRSGQQGLAQMDAPVGTLVAFSTAPGSVASDGTGNNGLYTQHLLTTIREPGTKIEDVFKKVRSSVRRDSHGKQVPWEATSLEGDFYFKAAAPVESTEASLEKAMWALIKDAGTHLEYKAFLNRFPHGLYAETASKRLAKLEAEQKPGTQPPPPVQTALATIPTKEPEKITTSAIHPLGFRVGDRWNYQVVDKYKGEVVENWSRKITQILPNGEMMAGRLWLSPEGNVISTNNSGKYLSRKFDAANAWLPSKMEVGHTESFRFTDVAKRKDGYEFEQVWQGTLTVKAKERVKVPAGEFDTYRIERQASVTGVQTSGNNRWSATNNVTVWYAPQIHYWVAADETHRVGSKAPDITRIELTSYELQ